MNSGDLEAARARRVQELKQRKEDEMKWASAGHGTFMELTDTKDFFAACKGSERVVVYFYRPTTRYADFVDGHLVRLASLHQETRFVKMNVEKTPYLNEKILADPEGNIIIPTILIVKHGQVQHHMRGIDEMGGEGFSTSVLAQILVIHGAIDQEAGEDEYNNTTMSACGGMTMDEYRAASIREGGFFNIDDDDDLSDEEVTAAAEDA